MVKLTASITFKLLLPLFVFLIAFGATLYVMLNAVLEQFDAAQAKSRGESILHSVEVGMDSGDAATNFRHMITSIALARDINYAVFIDPQSDRVITKSRYKYQQVSIDELPANISRGYRSLGPGNGVSFSADGESGFTYAAYVNTISPDKSSVETYALVLSLDRFVTSESVQVLRQQISVLFAASLLALLIFMTLVLRRVVITRVMRLVGTTRLSGSSRLRALAKLETADELGQLATQFAEMTRNELTSLQLTEQARERAELTARRKSEFLANMSHEIRTPLNGVLGTAQLALRSDNLPQVHGYLRTVMNSSKTLIGVINDILDFSKLAEEKLQLAPQNMLLTDALSRVENLLMPLARDKSLTFKLKLADNVPFVVHADGQRIEQLLINLGSNAIKFTDKGSVIVSVLWQGDERNGILKLVVADSGIGIAQEKISLLFEPFEQADNTTSRRFGGTGLGLAITRNLVELMQGSIDVHSRVGHGSRFELQIPMQARPFVPFLHQQYDASALPRLVCGECHTLVTRFVDAVNSFSTSSIEVMLIDVNRVPLEQVFPVAGPTLVMNLQDLSAIPDLPPASRDLQYCASFNDLESVLHTLLYMATGKRGPAVEAARELSGKRVLVVEDNDINAQVVCSMLEAFGMLPEHVENGQLAVDYLERHSADVVLMDVQMPVMDGYQATRMIRQELKSAVPVIGLSANVLPDDVQRAKDAGMDDYLGKPIEMEALREKLQQWLQTDAARDYPAPHQLRH